MRSVDYKGMKVTLSHGTEGPRHDPYSYDEYTFSFKRPNGKEVPVKLHLGLAEYLKVDDVDVTRKYLRLTKGRNWIDDNQLYKSIQKYFNKHFHISLIDFFNHIEGEAYGKSIEHCQKCGSDELDWKSGYPGESFLVCSKCGNIVESEFDPNAFM